MKEKKPIASIKKNEKVLTTPKGEKMISTVLKSRKNKNK